MAKETDVNFEYIPRLRYIVEIKNENQGQLLFTKRICSVGEAVKERDALDALIGLTARIYDTKTGKVLEGDFASNG